jgi:sec-independent protein translocase protein TatB
MNLGMPEMIFIFLLALLLFGPKKLPQVGRELGKALSEFKRASNEFKNQLETEIEQAEAIEQAKTSGVLPSQAPVEHGDTTVSPADDAGAAAAPPTLAWQETPGASTQADTALVWDHTPASEPTIAPPAEPVVASSLGQPTAPNTPNTTAAATAETEKHDQVAKASPETVAAEPASLAGVNAGLLDKSAVRDPNA